MKLLNRKSFIGLLLGASASTWIAQSRFVKSRFLLPDIEFLKQSTDLLAALCDLIIPRTETPGASDTSTHLFVAAYVEKCLPRSQQVIFVEGLKRVDLESLNKYNRPFLNCTSAQQDVLLKQIEADDQPWPGLVGRIEVKIMGKSFFQQLKSYTVLGYCTSQPVATGILTYDPIPGSYQGCVDYKESQNCNYSS